MESAPTMEWGAEGTSPFPTLDGIDEFALRFFTAFRMTVCEKPSVCHSEQSEESHSL